MKTLKEETPSEAAIALDEADSSDRPRRTFELNDIGWPPTGAASVGFSGIDNSLFARPADRMRAGWRRPSAPSIFQNLELGRRPSLTAPMVPLIPAGSHTLSSAIATVPENASPSSAPSTAVALRRPSAVVLVTTPTITEDKLRLVEESRTDTMNSRAPLHPHDSLDDDFSSGAQKFDDTITVYLSAMYAKLLVTLGIAFPITQTIAADANYYQGFHLYLYVGTFVFLACTYAEVLQSRALMFVVNSYRRKASSHRPSIHSMALKSNKERHHYGSFYLRLGAIAFGIGSMVYSGLEFGQYWELRMDCRRVTQALTPAARMVLTLVQMQFVFLNNRMVSKHSTLRQKLFAQFGLMHMIATNLCEWLTVIIEEAKHEIEHLPSEDEDDEQELVNATHVHHEHHPHYNTCPSTSVISSLVRNASPFLFPCTIEYSLICAVVLFEMWKNTHWNPESEEHGSSPPRYELSDLARSRSAHHLSVDCTKAHKGMFGGIVVVVLTIISLILFFVLQEAPGLRPTSLLVVSVCELCLYILTGLAVLAAFYKMRTLKHNPNVRAMGLDNTLLVIAQMGVFLYNLFSIVAYMSTGRNTRNLVGEMCGLIQTVCQTIFVLDASSRRCHSMREWRHKPGRQLVTFLLVANMAMWIVNTLEKGRASSRPILLEFYGNWPWTLIVHISMPLAIFYRFHSTICLFEIWKSCYKLKPQNSQRHRHSPEVQRDADSDGERAADRGGA